jgi:hypothetical protein
MANLTIKVDPETLKRTRIRALEQGASVNALLREYLESYASGPIITAGSREEQLEALERIIALANEANAGSGPDGRTWTREDLYDGPFGRARDE